jgi:hypothetical protein
VGGLVQLTKRHDLPYARLHAQQTQSLHTPRLATAADVFLQLSTGERFDFIVWWPMTSSVYIREWGNVLGTHAWGMYNPIQMFMPHQLFKIWSQPPVHSRHHHCRITARQLCVTTSRGVFGYRRFEITYVTFKVSDPWKRRKAHAQLHGLTCRPTKLHLCS